jgi:3-oxoacyl-[acyl-carrier protein] reductase
MDAPHGSRERRSKETDRMDRFSGKVVLVTGAARGIGFATADLVASEGTHVVVCDIALDSAADAAARLHEQHRGQTLGLGCDVTDEAAVDALFERVIAEFGTIDVLVNNAGVTRDNLLFKMSVSDWDTVMDVHLRGTFLCTRAAQRTMVKRKSGKIVNLSSTSALGNRGQANYSTAKAGLQAFTRTAAVELGPYNINVNAVAPGFIDTEMTRQTATRLGFDPEDYKAQRAKAIPLGRVGVPRDIANVIAFLCSEEASFVSGQIIYVKGGPETTR